MKQSQIYVARFPLFGAAIRLCFNIRPSEDQVFEAFKMIWEGHRNATTLIVEAKKQIKERLQIEETVFFTL